MNVLNTLHISPLSPCVSWGDVILFIMIWAAILFAAWKKACDVQEDVHATARWLARMEAYRLRVAGRQTDGGNDDDED